ncbi:MAG: glutamate--tRNA ligase [Thermodesulfobacteriota bacterium]
MTVRTRFAPSPTGYLHIGGARTALFNYLYARGKGGKFILRIEDTDQARSTDESTRAILDGMAWLGMEADEGPFFQSERFDLYRAKALELLEKGHAYYCYCDPDELKARRDKAKHEGRSPKYDGRCRTVTSDSLGDKTKHGALRFRVDPGKSAFKDLIKGGIAIEHEEIEDFIIVRSNGTPTYNLCVTVDDAEMGVTHNIRGDDHINNTPKQILLYEALGYDIPLFAHLPMILGADKARLSKRHGATSVIAYKEMGYLPEALINYLARLGWSSGDEEIFTMDELIEKFSLESVGKSSGVFNPEKLLWLNQHYIKESTDERLAELLKPHLIALDDINPNRIHNLPYIVKNLKERAKTLVEMAEGARFFFVDEVTFEEKAERKFLTHDRLPYLKFIEGELEEIQIFTEETIESTFSNAMEEYSLKLGKLAQPVRVALTGGTVSPGIFETITALGREKTLERLAKAIKHIESKEDEESDG